MRRTITRSSSIRQIFSEEYTLLTELSDIVVSTAQQFSWAGGYAQLLGGAGLMQKLPFRAVVGLAKNKSGHITYASAKAYAPAQKKIIDIALSSFVDTHNPELFREYVVPLLPHWDPEEGLEIQVILECDWVDTVPLFVGIAAGIMIASGAVSPDFFIMASKASAKELQESIDTKNTLELLWKIACILENGYLYTPTITEVAVCLTSAHLPVVTQTEDMTEHLRSDGRLSFNAKEILEQKAPAWFIHKYDEQYPGQQSMPFEWGILSSGSHHMLPLHFSHEKSIPAFGNMEELSKHLENSTKTPVSDHIWLKRKMEMMHAYTINAIDAFKNSLKSHDASSFLQTLHAMHEVSHLLQFNRLDHVTGSASAPFKEFLKEHLRGNYNYLITEKGMRGDAKVFFAAPRHVLSGHMEALRKLYPETGSAAFEYLSWLDGFGNTGVEIEHMRPFLRTNKNQSVEMHSTKNTYDMSIDCTRKKISVGLHRITSNDVRSQHFTVDLLHALFQTPGRAIPLATLPRLSYVDTPNELSQKVLLPIIKTIHKHTGKVFSLFTELRGGSWWVCLGESDVRISFSHDSAPGMLCRKNAAVQEHLLAIE